MNARAKLMLLIVSLFSIFLIAACSSGSDETTGDSSDSTYSGASIKGVVEADGTVAPAAAGGYLALSGRTFRPLSSHTLSGCTITVRDIDTGTVIATASTDANGVYIVDELTSGTNYEVIADCGTTTYTSFASADTVDPTSAAKDVDTVDAQSTLIAAYISKSIKDAVSAAISGIGNATIEAAIKDAIFAAIDQVIAQVEEEIRSALDSGQLVIDDALATQLAVDQEASIGSEDTPPDPGTILTGVGQDTSVIDAASEASTAFLALRSACDTDVNQATTVNDCIQQLAKTIYGLKEPVFLVLDDQPNFDGSFGTEGLTVVLGAANCTPTWAAANGFPEAKTTFIDDSVDGTDLTGLFACAIEPLVKAFNRNDPSGQYGGGDDDDLMWHDYEGGLLRAMANSLINGQRYTISALDELIVGYEELGSPGSGDFAGLNMRYFGFDKRGSTFYYDNSATQWRSFPLRDDNCPECGTISEDDIRSAFNADWTENTTDIDGTPDEYDYLAPWTGDAPMQATVQSLVQAVSASYMPADSNPPGFATDVADWFKGANGLTKEEALAAFNDDRIHIQNNPSGPVEFRVLYGEQPDNQDVYDAGTDTWSRSPCEDNDPSTPCLDITGTAEPVVRAIATKDGNGFINTITISDAGVGDLMFEPVWTQNGATTALRVISEVQEADLTWRVKYLRNKYGDPLIVYAVTQGDVDNGASVCDMAPTNPWEGRSNATDISCAAGDFYMVFEYWMPGMNGNWDVEFVRASDAPISVTSPGPITDLMTENISRVSANFGDHDEWGLLGYYGQDGDTALRFTLADNAGAPDLTEVPDTGAWYIKAFEDCDMTGCTSLGYGFLNAGSGTLLDSSDGTLGAIGTQSFDATDAAILADTVICSDIQTTIDWFTGAPANANQGVIDNLQSIIDDLTAASKCNTGGGGSVDWYELPGLFFAEQDVEVSYDGGSTWATETAWLPNPTVRVVTWAQIAAAVINSRGSAETLADVVLHWDIFNGPYANQGWDADQAPAFLDANDNGVRDAGETIFDNDWEIEWRLMDQYWSQCDPDNLGGYANCDEWVQAMANQDMDLVVEQDNGWAFGNNVLATKLLNAAFDFTGGSMTVTDTTQFDGLQIFAALFLRFENEGGQSQSLTVYDFDGTLQPDPRDLEIHPMSFGEGEDDDMNIPFANGFCAFSVGAAPDGCPYPYP